jgi:LPS sulfotransferase NodH
MTAPDTSIVLLLAHDRSGTHLLRSILNRTGRIAAPSEVCNASMAPSHQKLSFFEFRRAHLTNGANSPYPTAQTQGHVIREYFDFIKSVYPDKDIVVLDVKYFHVHNFNLFWWDFSTAPFLLRYAKRYRIRIIHLVRKNVFQTAMSCLYTKQSGVWRASRPEQLNKITITVDCESLRRRISQIGNAISLFDKWLLGCDRIRITYEALAGPSPQATLESLSAFLDLDSVIPFKPRVVKTTPPYEHCIANWGEVKELAAAFDKVTAAPAIIRGPSVRSMKPIVDRL